MFGHLGEICAVGKRMDVGNVRFSQVFDRLCLWEALFSQVKVTEFLNPNGGVVVGKAFDQ